MKKFALTTAAVLLGFAPLALADDKPATPAPNPECCTPDASCKTSCTQTDKGIQYGEDVWLDIETVTLEAENGNPIAQYTVAYLIEAQPEATAADAEKAKEWYAKSLPGLEKAAAEGHPGACCALAHMYAEGKGVEKNPDMAAKYMKMYKELCDKKCKEKKHSKHHENKPCCPMGPGPVQPPCN